MIPQEHHLVVVYKLHLSRQRCPLSTTDLYTDISTVIFIAAAITSKNCEANGLSHCYQGILRQALNK